jgi:hypothetical protein
MISFILTGLVLFFIWFEIAVYRALKKYQVNVFFSPDGYLSLRSNIPQIGVIHDINFEHYPEDLPWSARIYLRYFFPKFAKKAKKIITAIQENFGEDNVIPLIDNLDENVISSIVSEIKKVNKIKDQDKTDEIREHLLLNIRLTRLSIKVFPDEIREALIEFFESYEMTNFNSREFSTLKNNLSLI